MDTLDIQIKARFLWRALRARFRDQRCELQALRLALKRGDTAIDVGANKGSYIFWLSRWTTPGRVVAFEPQVSLVQYLQQACKVLALTNVKIEAAAVANSCGSSILHIPGAGDSPGASLSQRISERETCRDALVPVFSLDDYFRGDNSIGAIKVDVEGYELNVFQGAERILREQSPVLVFECENRHLETGSVKDIFDYLAKMKYQGYFIWRYRLFPISEFNEKIHQRETGERFWDEQDYCNNFVFRKKA